MVVRELITRFGFDVDNQKINRLEGRLKSVSRRLGELGRGFNQVGKSLSLKFTAPFAAASAISLRNWDQQAKAIEQVKQGLLSTGGVVGLTFNQLAKEAERIQDITLFPDETVLKDATAQLLTFTNIVGDQFLKTQVATLDVATRVGQDLRSTAIQLGKALNDPVANLGALSRTGIQFSKEQKKVIKNLAETNRLAQAQEMILDELNKQYGGSAAAAARVGLGPWQQIINTMGDLMEDFGKIILEDFLEPILPTIKEWKRALKEMSPEAKKAIIIFSGLAAVLGPLLILAGNAMLILSFLGTSFTGLVVAMAPVLAWTGLIVGALGILFLLIDDFRGHLEGKNALFAPLYDGAIEAFEAVRMKIMEFGSTVKEFLSDFALVFKTDVMPILEVFGKIAKFVFMELVWRPISEAIKLLKILGGLIMSVGSSLLGLIKKIPFLGEIGNFLKDAAIDAIPGVALYKGIKGRAEQIRESEIVRGENARQLIEGGGSFAFQGSPVTPTMGDRTTNNQFKIEQKVEVNVQGGSEADPERIAEAARMATRNELDKMVRRAAEATEAVSFN